MAQQNYYKANLRDLSFLLFEQFKLGHARGSSHGTSRIFRLNYPDPRYVRMALAADAEWRRLEDACGERLIERVGCLDLGPVARETERALSACGARYERLTADDVRARWPLRLDPGQTAVFQADGGITRADRAHAALLAEAVAGGVELRERTFVRELVLDRREVHLVTDGDELTARAVVVTAGAWAPRLLTTAGIDLPVVPTRETGLRAAFDALAARLLVTPIYAAEVDDMAMIRLLARADAGLAVIPPIVVRDELQSGALVEASRLDGIGETFFAVTRERRFPNPLLRDVLPG